MSITTTSTPIVVEKGASLWRDAAHRTVDDAHMRYFIVHLHRLLDPEHDAEAANR